MKYKFKWANGSAVSIGNSIEEACSNIKTNPSKIITGFLVSVKQLRNPNKPQGKSGLTLTKWWDAEMFWKHLKGKKQDDRVVVK